MYCCCNSRAAGSLTFPKGNTWAAQDKLNRIKTAAYFAAYLAAYLKIADLFPIFHSRRLVRRIGNGADVSNHSVNLRRLESGGIPGHLRRLTQCRPAMSNHVIQIGVRNSIQSRAVSELMRRGRKIVQIRYALGGGFRIVTAYAVLVIHGLAQRFFITKSSFAESKRAGSSPCFGRFGNHLIIAIVETHLHGGGDLAAGISERLGRGKLHPFTVKGNQGSANAI